VTERLRWLVTGGAGYIGSHVVAALTKAGERVVIMDDLSSGHAEPIGEMAPLVVGTVHDGALMRRTLATHRVTAVVHTAARKDAAASVHDPAGFRRANIGGLHSVLAAMRDVGVARLVFSSSAAVSGPSDRPVRESAPLAPGTPYGWTKAEGERLLARAAARYGLRYVALRYFNVAGAGDPRLADLDSPSVLSAMCRAVLTGGQPVVYGSDYPTPDGSCIRDFIHVADVAEAHRAVSGLLEHPGCAHTFNVGTGHGSSIRQVLTALQDSCGQPVVATVGARRPGDIPTSVANVDHLRTVAGWSARHSLPDIVTSHWRACGVLPRESGRSRPPLLPIPGTPPQRRG